MSPATRPRAAARQVSWSVAAAARGRAGRGRAAQGVAAAWGHWSNAEGRESGRGVCAVGNMGKQGWRCDVAELWVRRGSAEPVCRPGPWLAGRAEGGGGQGGPVPRHRHPSTWPRHLACVSAPDTLSLPLRTWLRLHFVNLMHVPPQSPNPHPPCSLQRILYRFPKHPCNPPRSHPCSRAPQAPACSPPCLR